MFNPFKTKSQEETPDEIKESCIHVWNLFAKTYAAPNPSVNVELSEPLLQKVLFGVTTYMWECINCGHLRSQESLGSDENQLFDILDKASKEGIQYVEFADKKFGIALVPKDDGPNIPLR